MSPKLYFYSKRILVEEINLAEECHLCLFFHCAHSSSACSLWGIVAIQCYPEKGSDCFLALTVIMVTPLYYV